MSYTYLIGEHCYLIWMSLNGQGFSHREGFKQEGQIGPKLFSLSLAESGLVLTDVVQKRFIGIQYDWRSRWVGSHPQLGIRILLEDWDRRICPRELGNQAGFPQFSPSIFLNSTMKLHSLCKKEMPFIINIRGDTKITFSLVVVRGNQTGQRRLEKALYFTTVTATRRENSLEITVRYAWSIKHVPIWISYLVKVCVLVRNRQEKIRKSNCLRVVVVLTAHSWLLRPVCVNCLRIKLV